MTRMDVLFALIGLLATAGSVRSTSGQVIVGGGTPIKAEIEDKDGNKAVGTVEVAQFEDGTMVNMARYKLTGVFSYSSDLTCDSSLKPRWATMYKGGGLIGKDTRVTVVRRKDEKTVELGKDSQFQTLSALGRFVFLIGCPGSTVTLQPGVSVRFGATEVSPAEKEPVTFRVDLKDGKPTIGEVTGGKLNVR